MQKRSSKPSAKKKTKKKPLKDINQLGKFLVDKATKEDIPNTEDGKNAAAVALGRLGGLKGGKARAAKLSAEERSEIAKKAAIARWKKKDK